MLRFQFYQSESGLLRWHSGKESACQCRRHKRLGFNPWVGKIPLEEEMATYSSILAWEISQTEELGRLQSMRVAKSWTTLSDFHFFSQDDRPIFCYETPYCVCLSSSELSKDPLACLASDPI